MRKFRKIIVNSIEYKWLFQYDNYNYIRFPYLLIIMKSYPKATLNIEFPIAEHWLLNSGLPAHFENNMVSINLNQPKYISKIIQQCRKNGEEFKEDGYKYLNGLVILKQIGYEINESGIYKRHIGGVNDRI